jgi:hypothetical protein
MTSVDIRPPYQKGFTAPKSRSPERLKTGERRHPSGGTMRVNLMRIASAQDVPSRRKKPAASVFIPMSQPGARVLA